MPLIEELPVTGPTRVSHGWAYVPDTGPIPAMAPPGARKRNRNDAGTTNATATAKQQKSIQQRLESLDRENHKDGVTVPIPARTGANAREGKPARKMTSNVRRILTYQRTFQHYLADEEAGAGGTAAVVSATQPATQKVDGRRKSAVVAATPAVDSTAKVSVRGGRRNDSEAIVAQDSTPRRRPGRPRTSIKQEDVTMTGTDTNDGATAQSATPGTASDKIPALSPQRPPPVPPTAAPPHIKPPYDPKLDAHPLLRTLNLPKMPSDRVMQALLSEPPLSYKAARAKDIPSESFGSGGGTGEAPTVAKGIANLKPSRHFCALCGYWGKVKCRKCGEWTCGLMECWKGHEGVCVALGMY